METVKLNNGIDMPILGYGVYRMSPYGTRLMAWAPLAQSSDDLFSNEVLKELAFSHGKTVTQVALRYLLQRGIIAIPKTTRRNLLHALPVADIVQCACRAEPSNRTEYENIEFNPRMG